MDAPQTLPTGPELLALERQSRANGSKLVAADLLGCWRLENLWSKSEPKPLGVSAGLLRLLQASLTIAAAGVSLAPQAEQPVSVFNSVQLGPFQLCFCGQGLLRGKRPLLEFWFEALELRLGQNTLWRQPIKAQPPQRRRPFFALIASQNGWLAARGRGGGLALWLQEDR
jgi:hypothetical protein